MRAAEHRRALRARRSPQLEVCALKMPNPPDIGILFVGDVVGGIGRRTLLGLLPALRERYRFQFVIANGENAAGGVGITPKVAEELFAGGVERAGVRVGVISISGNLYMNAGRHAFSEIDVAVHGLRARADQIVVDVHAEATSEKVAM